MKLSERVKELGLELPPPPPPQGVYKPTVIVGNTLYVSGQGPMQSDGTLIYGRLGDDMELEGGYKAARQVGLAMLATILSQHPDIEIFRIIKTLGMVNSTPEYGEHPKTINGFSDLMAEVFGPDNGIGARSAVGMMLPGNIPVEIEAIFEVKG